MGTWRGLVLSLSSHRLRPDQKSGPGIPRRGSLTNLQCPFAIWCYGNLPGMALFNPPLNEPTLFPNRITLFPAGQEEDGAESGSLILKPICPFHGPWAGVPTPSPAVFQALGFLVYSWPSVSAGSTSTDSINLILKNI